jgi:hypothetical protein
MKKTILTLIALSLMLVTSVFADVILDNNGDTTVTGDLDVQGTLSGTNIQRPLTSTCAVGSHIRAIYPDGTVICELDSDTNTDTLGGLSCSQDEIAKWTGSVWECTTQAVCPQGALLSCYTGTPGTSEIGVCVQGTSTCLNGAWTSCIGEITDRTETCDGFDDDCDGQVDEGCTPTCGNGVLETGEECDDGIANGSTICGCDINCSYAPSTTECRAASGPCDATEFCDGAGSCPPNYYLTSSSVCRSSTGICDPTEYCTGSSSFCPSDIFQPNGTACGAGSTCDDNGVCLEVYSSIIITEVMVDSSAVSDTVGEWFEVYNTLASAVDMNSWVISDLGTDTFTINAPGGLIVQPGSFAVLCKNSDTATNGNFACDYEYSNFILGNSGDEIILTFNSIEVDRVSYIGTWPFSVGKTMELSGNHFDYTQNDNSANWCSAVTTYGLGDSGTPGTTNDCAN